MAADVRQSKDFSFLFLLTSPFLDACTTDEGKDTPRGITRRIITGPEDQNRMVGQTKLGSDQNLFSTFRFSTSFVAGTLAASGIPLCPHIVGHRGFIGAGSRLQVSSTLLIHRGSKKLINFVHLASILGYFFPLGRRDVFQAAHALCPA